MGRRRKKYNIEPWASLTTSDSFVSLYRTMLNSEAYKDLRHASRTVYTILRLQYNGTGDTVKCPYKDFKEYGLDSTTVRRALTDLEEHGFIKVTHGALVTKNLHKDANEYQFVTGWRTWTKSQSTKKTRVPPTRKEKSITL